MVTIRFLPNVTTDGLMPDTAVAVAWTGPLVECLPLVGRRIAPVHTPPGL
jgi:hypothetical protein